MFTFSAFTFANPLALLALLALPAIYWLVRFTPPKPQTVRFAPFRLLRDLISRNEQPDRAPWWLTALRLALAALVIMAIAGPFWNTGAPPLRTGTAPLLIVIDNDWSSAPQWDRRMAVLDEIITAAERAGTPVILAASTPDGKPQALTAQSPANAKKAAAVLAPRALATARPQLARRLVEKFASQKALQIAWLANGIGGTKAENFAKTLKSLAGGKAKVEIFTPAPDHLPVAVSNPMLAKGAFKITVLRPDGNTKSPSSVDILAANGRSLASAKFKFDGNKTSTEVTIKLPLELRNEAARIEVTGARSAGAVYLLDDRWRRKVVGVIAGPSSELAQPLLSPLYYVTRALEPSAALRTASEKTPVTKLIDDGISMLVLADVGAIAPADRAAIGKWLQGGGVLLRFAGPHLARAGALARDDELIPVRLRRGGRSLGSALGWERPQGLAPFEDKSPLAGLAIPGDIKVTRQVLAEPSAALAGRVWARLEDGTPLITAARSGNGLVVLVHVTANADWSNLPLSGLFVEILQRILDIAPAAPVSPKAGANLQLDVKSGPFQPRRTLTGFGRLTMPPASAEPLAAKDFAKATPSPRHPAGLYQRGPAIRALNLALTEKDLARAAYPAAGAAMHGYTPAPQKPLAGYLFAAAALMFLLDCIAALYLGGGWQRLKASGRAMAPVLAFFMFTALAALPLPVHAQESASEAARLKTAMQATLETRFAYVRTGDNRVDATSHAGLRGLNLALSSRTSVEPGEPAAINIEKDEIVFYPLLYWPVLASAKPPGPKTIAKLNAFLKNGGTIFFDTRDYNASFANLTGTPSPAGLALRAIVENLDIPPLEPVPPRHVLTRAFYLLQRFPGRYAGGKLWVEAGNSGKPANDGVSPVIVGSNDYAAAWAIDETGRPLNAVIPGARRQREFAWRTGINIAMYTLTGNYKADQVHVPALLERLGQ